MTDWEDLTTEEKLDQLREDIDDLERRVEVVSQDYAGLDKLREEVDALKRVATIPDGGENDE